jgi:16S rRNA (uracil1498-N3)-methyltransferase
VHRFFVPSADRTGTVASLPEDEAVHLTRVLRVRVGDTVRVFDGRGHEWMGEVCGIARHSVRVRLGEAVVPAPEPQVSMTLAVAVLKGEKMDEVVRDAVMLGVIRIIPLVTERTEVSLSAIARGRRIDRWQRIAVSSAKQCGRALVPPVAEAAGLSGTLAGGSAGTRVMLVEPRSPPLLVSPLRELPAARAVTLFIGPEGGWTDAEVQSAAAARAILTTLGRLTLRADAVPTVAVTALRVLWNDL